MEYKLTIQMRYPDFDMQCVVNHAVIDTYIELAYISFIKNHINPEWNFLSLPYKVVDVYTKCQSSIRPDSNPVVIITVSKILNTWFELNVKIADEKHPEKIYATGTRQLVHLVKDKVSRIDDRTISELQKFFTTKTTPPK